MPAVRPCFVTYPYTLNFIQKKNSAMRRFLNSLVAVENPDEARFLILRQNGQVKVRKG